MNQTKAIPPEAYTSAHFHVIIGLMGSRKYHTNREYAAYGGEFLDDGIRMVEQPMKQNQIKFYAHTQGF